VPRTVYEMVRRSMSHVLLYYISTTTMFLLVSCETFIGCVCLGMKMILDLE
jgi:hypothetical protein